VFQRDFYAIYTDPTLAWEIVRRHFVTQTHRNALRDLHLLPDAYTQVRRNVSQCNFYGIHIGPTGARKIMH
jgi:hypothetical protein